MRSFTTALFAALSLSVSTHAADDFDYSGVLSDHFVYGSTFDEPNKVSSRQSDSSCTNGPLTRQCWSNGYSVDTDFDEKWPTTGVTRSYNWDITNTTCNPDGHGERICLLVNGQYPGPLVSANWGDTIEVTMTNNMQHNGTSVHWHGLRQYKTNEQDGTNGLTQCPLAPGKTQTFSFLATQFGTSWYHSHHSSQYGDGIVGPIVINGPASANYDIDLGALPLSDWYYTTAPQTVAQANDAVLAGGAPPNCDNVLINGTNKDAAGNGNYSVITLTPGKTHRLRLINTAMNYMIRFSIDQHPMTLITTDFVPIKPTTVDSVLLGIGQRYDVIIEANSTLLSNLTSGNFWMRATVEDACYPGSNNPGMGIVRYSNAPKRDPLTISTAIDTGCTAPPNLVPYVANVAGNESDFKSQASNMMDVATYPGVSSNNQSIVQWALNTSAIDISWEKPTLEYVVTGNTSYPSALNLIALPNANVWTYWIMQETTPGDLPPNIPHPIHLHGHDFLILGTGAGNFSYALDANSLNFNNPTRRDTAILPAGGWLAVAFITDNPGSWLMHCHITVHIDDGMGVQFLETPSLIQPPNSAWHQQCSDWSTYEQTAVYKQDNSGL